jgi:3-methyladenine DNA glycosylase/8-oxoguanine DNA glycosylase
MSAPRDRRWPGDLESPPIDRVIRLGFEVDVGLTLAPLRHGRGDPTIRFEEGSVWRAVRTAEGPACLRISPAGGAWRVTAWGRGGELAADSVPRLLGAGDDPAALVAPSGLLRDLAHRFRNVRFGRSDAVMASLLPAIVEQKVTGREAQRAWRSIVLRFGERAPGPAGLHLPPEPATLARVPYFALHPLGLEQRRAVTLIRAAERADWLEGAIRLSPDDAMTRLRTIPGIGAWTAAETVRAALGDADAVSVGDYHTPSLVTWALAGEPRGEDARMLELLEPYRGQRARIVRLLELSGLRPPRYGPRYAGRSIAAM